MIILLLLAASVDARIDSLESAFAQSRDVATLVELSRCYIAAAEYHKSIELLKQHERHFRKDTEKAVVMYETGNAYLFAGDIVKAHDVFLRLVGTYPAFDIANDAADRLYLVEAARYDTVQLKRLINVVRLYETSQYAAAIDSAKALLKTLAGIHAYYYLALAYDAQGDVPMALGALLEMRKEHRVHSVYAATLLEADLYIRLNRNKEARETLENLIVLQPNTIYAFRARQRLQILDQKPE